MGLIGIGSGGLIGIFSHALIGNNNSLFFITHFIILDIMWDKTNYALLSLQVVVNIMAHGKVL